MNRVNAYATLILCLLAATQAALAQQTVDDTRFEIGGYLTGIGLSPLETIVTIPERVIRTSDFNRGYPGIGSRFGYNFNRVISIEAEGNFFPKLIDGEVSKKAQFLAGLKTGIRTEHFGIYAKARPGLMYFGSIPSHTICSGSCVKKTQTNFAFDLGGVVEYYPSPRTIVRVDFGDTLVHFKTVGPTPGFNFSILTPAQTIHNFQFSIGFGWRL
jgi:opacity protein-like surface antigen